METNTTTHGLLSVSPAPHLRNRESIARIMWTVNAALAPAAIFAIIHFGLNAAYNLLAAMAAAVLTELVIQKIRRIPVTIADGSALMTGLLLAMCIPPGISPVITVFGSVVAIAVAKQAMGGLGYNIFNPAHVGRAVMMVSYPVAMTTWTALKAAGAGVDAVTTATPLSLLKLQGYDHLVAAFGSRTELYKALFLGFRNGSIGETSTLLLLLGGLFLIYKGYIRWHVPVFMIGTVGLLTWIFGPAGLFTGDPLFHMMAGGLIIGAFFMATDMVTTPITVKGQILFAVGAGALTVLIRLVGGYPEGVCYAILLMNAVTPLIDRFIQPKIFGSEVKRRG